MDIDISSERICRQLLSRKMLREMAPDLLYLHQPSSSALLELPFEIRQLIYHYTLSTTISITDPRLSRAPTLEEVSFLASRRANWCLALCCRSICAEIKPLFWDCLTISLSKDGTSFEGDDGRHRLGNADQAFRRRIRHVLVSDPACYGMCYGLMHCANLETLTIAVDRVDGILLEKGLMDSPPDRIHHKPWGRKLTIELEVVEAPGISLSGMMINSGKQDGVQSQWRREYAQRGNRLRFMFLSNLIPALPRGCQVIIRAKVLDATLQVLKAFEGFCTSSTGKDQYLMRYDDDI